MTAQNRTVLKSYFETGDRPTQTQFSDLIDSFVLSTGDTMTGLLVLSADPSAALGAATKQYVDNSVTGVSPPFSDSTSIVKGSADATKLLRFEVDGFTTGTTRVLTAPNFDGTIATLAGTETFTNKTLTTPVFSGNPTGTVTSGNYSPTLTIVANVDTVVLVDANLNYSRVGDTVTVSGGVTIDPTSSATLTEIGISLPIASDFTGAGNCGGVGMAYPSAVGAAIFADTVNNRAQLSYTSVGTASQNFYFSFTYRIL